MNGLRILGQKLQIKDNTNKNMTNETLIPKYELFINYKLKMTKNNK